MRDPLPSFSLQILPILIAQGSCDSFQNLPKCPQKSTLSLHSSSLTFLNSQGAESVSALVLHSSCHMSQHSVSDLMDLARYVVNSCWKAGILPCFLNLYLPYPKDPRKCLACNRASVNPIPFLLFIHWTLHCLWNE